MLQYMGRMSLFACGKTLLLLAVHWSHVWNSRYLYYIALTKIDSKVCQLTEVGVSAIRVYDNVTSVKFQYVGI